MRQSNVDTKQDGVEEKVAPVRKPWHAPQVFLPQPIEEVTESGIALGPDGLGNS